MTDVGEWVLVARDYVAERSRGALRSPRNKQPFTATSSQLVISSKRSLRASR